MQRTQKFFSGSQSLDSKLGEYGVYMRDHEVRKQLMLQDIEEVREGNGHFYLRESYGLDPSSAYFWN